MLAMSIQPGGCVKIGDDIKIYNREDHWIDIAIDAPKEVVITRSNTSDPKAITR